MTYTDDNFKKIGKARKFELTLLDLGTCVTIVLNCQLAQPFFTQIFKVLTQIYSNQVSVESAFIGIQ